MAKINRIIRSSSSLVTLAELQSGSELFTKTTIRKTQITPELTGTAALVKRAEVIRRVIDRIVYNDTVSGAQVFADYLLPTDSALLLFIRGRFVDDALNTADNLRSLFNKQPADSLGLQDIITIIKISERFFQHSILPQSQTTLRLDKSQSELVGIADQTTFNVNLGLTDQLFMADIVAMALNYSFQEILGLDDVARLDVVKSLQHDLNVQEVAVLYYAKNLIDVLAAVDTKILDITQLKTDVVDLQDAQNTAVALNKNHTVFATDAAAQSVSLTKFDDAILSEFVGLDVFKSVSEATTVFDAARNLLAKFFAEDIIPVDLAGVFDGITYYYGLSRALNVAVGDEYRAAVTYLRSLEDTALISDVVSNLVSKQFSHAVSVTDVLVTLLARGIRFEEQLSINDVQRLNVIKLLVDDQSLLDAKSLASTKTLADDNNINDVLRLILGVFRTLADDNTVSDIAKLSIVTGRTIQDSSDILDAKSLASTKTLADDNNINDVLRLTASVSRTLADSSATADATAKNIGKRIIRSDQLDEAIGSLTQSSGVFTNSNIYDSSTSIVISAAGTGLGTSGGFPTWSHFRFASATPRILTSDPIDFTKYPRIDFLYVVGNSSNGGESPDTNENLILEYFHVTNGWTTAVTIHAGGVVANNNARRGWTPFSFNLAATTSGLVSNVTRFRIRQNLATSSLDNYGIANLTLRGGEFALPQDYEIFSMTKLLRETATPADNIRRVFGTIKIFTELSIVTDNSVKTLNKTIADPALSQDYEIFNLTKLLRETATPADNIRRVFGVSKTELSIVTDNSVKTLNKAIADPALDLRDATRFVLQYNFADTAITEDLTGIADGLNYSAVLSRAHKVSISDVIAKYLSIQLRSTDITVLDEISVLNLRGRGVTDDQTLADLYSLSIVKTIDSTVNTADRFAKSLGLIVSELVDFYQPNNLAPLTEGTTSNVQYVTGFALTSYGTVATLGSQVCVLVRASDDTSVGYRSTDRGLTWSTQDFVTYDFNTSTTNSLVFVHQQTSDRVTSVALLHPLYSIQTSTDFGATWSSVTDSWTGQNLDTGFYAPVWDQGRGAFFAWARIFVTATKASPAQYNWRHVYSSGATTQAGTRWSRGNTLVDNSGTNYFPYGSASGIPSSTSIPSTLLVLGTGDVYAYQGNSPSIATSGVLVQTLTFSQPEVYSTNWMAFGNGMFVVLDANGRVHRSTSITTWNTVNLPGNNNTDTHGVVWDTGLQQFVISAGGKGEGLSADKIVPTFYFSADAINWTSSYSRYSNVRYAKSGTEINAKFAAFSGEYSTGTSVLIAFTTETSTTSIIRTEMYAGTTLYRDATPRGSNQPSAMRYDVALSAKRGVAGTVQLKTIQTTNQYSSVFVTRSSADTDLVGSIDILKKDPALQKSDILVTADAERFSSTTIKRETVPVLLGGVGTRRIGSAVSSLVGIYFAESLENLDYINQYNAATTTLIINNSLIWDTGIGVYITSAGVGTNQFNGFPTYTHYRFDTTVTRVLTSKISLPANTVTIRFLKIRGSNFNGGDATEASDNLILDFLSSNGTWIQWTVVHAGNDTGSANSWVQTSITRTFAEPAKFRFRNTALGGFNIDNYGVTNVEVYQAPGDIVPTPYGTYGSIPIYGGNVEVSEVAKDVDLLMARGVAGSVDLKTQDAVQSVPNVYLQSSVTVTRTSRDRDEVGAVDLFRRVYGTQQQPAENSGDLDPFGNINTMVSNGSLRMTDYVDIEYLENDYVGASRSFS
jgi:hypothetical protein